MIKYSQAKTILSKYAGIAGTCSNAEEVDLFVKKVLQYLLINGAYGNIRKFTFCAENGCITLPKELETPLKIKVGKEVGSVWSRWYEFHYDNQIGDDCLPGTSLLEEANRYPTVYDIPRGYYPATYGTCNEDADSHIVVKGEDITGRTIYTKHKGQDVVGVYLSIVKGVLQRSPVPFGRITEVSKTRTNGYVNFVGLSESGYDRKWLADYNPYEESPSYIRAKFITPCPPVCYVSILGRIRLKDYYADDDLIPFDNLFILEVAGQNLNNMRNNDINATVAGSNFVSGLIEKEGAYKKVNNGEPLEMFTPLSGGAVMNARRAGNKLRRIGFGFRRGPI